jgi:hypothetical protein
MEISLLGCACSVFFQKEILPAMSGAANLAAAGFQPETPA